MEQSEIEAIVRRALDEDLSDITSEAIFQPTDRGRARFIAKAPGVIAGLAFADATFHMIEPSARILSRAALMAAPYRPAMFWPRLPRR